ncbi:MAG: hypothetical protein ABH919_02565 [bacterium]
MEIIVYKTGPSALDLAPKGLNRCKTVEHILRKRNLSLKNIVFVDDMLISMFPFSERGSFLMCPANAQEKVKELVLEKGGFVSTKRSTEAMAEFLTDIYPNLCKKWHKSVHSIIFDKDGCLWERQKIKQSLPSFEIITDYVKNCKGPFTESPPISVATGASEKSVIRMLRYIQINKENIPEKLRQTWLPIIMEEGCLSLDPITETLIDFTENRYGLFPPGQQKLIKLIMDIGEKINKRALAINKTLGAKCEIVKKERAGYTIGLPFKTRNDPEEVKNAHVEIYKQVKDLLENLPPDIGIEFHGLLTKKELDR